MIKLNKERLKHIMELIRQGYSESEVLDRMEIYDNIPIKENVQNGTK